METRNKMKKEKKARYFGVLSIILLSASVVLFIRALCQAPLGEREVGTIFEASEPVRDNTLSVTGVEIADRLIGTQGYTQKLSVKLNDKVVKINTPVFGEGYKFGDRVNVSISSDSKDVRIVPNIFTQFIVPLVVFIAAIGSIIWTYRLCKELNSL